MIEEYCYSSWMDSCLSATRVVLICLPTCPRFWIIAPNSGTTWAFVFSKRIPLMRRQHFLSSSSLLICSSTSLIKKENEFRLFLRVNKDWLALDEAIFLYRVISKTYSFSFFSSSTSIRREMRACVSYWSCWYLRAVNCSICASVSWFCWGAATGVCATGSTMF